MHCKLTPKTRHTARLSDAAHSPMDAPPTDLRTTGLTPSARILARLPPDLRCLQSDHLPPDPRLTSAVGRTSTPDPRRPMHLSPDPAAHNLTHRTSIPPPPSRPTHCLTPDARSPVNFPPDPRRRTHRTPDPAARCTTRLTSPTITPRTARLTPATSILTHLPPDPRRLQPNHLPPDPRCTARLTASPTTRRTARLTPAAGNTARLTPAAHILKYLPPDPRRLQPDHLPPDPRRQKHRIPDLASRFTARLTLPPTTRHTARLIPAARSTSSLTPRRPQPDAPHARPRRPQPDTLHA
uniref:Extensin-like n=1 Tax=Castor canadensis TaxID=51338 RepID=A0A8B7TP00_CASCN|nr:extensin-like [Castor canadensis]